MPKNYNLSLRPLKQGDKIIFTKYFKDKKMTRWMTSVPQPYTRKDAEKFIRKKQREAKQKKSYAFTIQLEGEVVGVASIREIDWKNKRAMIGYWVASAYWNRGIAERAAKLLVDYAFRELGLNRLEARVMKPNKASQRVLEKSGFKKEGVKSKRWLINGRWVDEVDYGRVVDKNERKKYGFHKRKK